MTDTALVPMTALDRLRKKAERTSYDDLKRSQRRSLLLVDCSGSMDSHTLAGERKIDALRKVVDKLRTSHPVPMAAFGFPCNRVELVEFIPEPMDGTPMHAAIDFGRMQEATHLVIVTDGVPDDHRAAFAAAKRFGHPIDVFYIGDGSERGAQFCADLAQLTGGKCGVTDLVGDPKQLAGKIAGLLGDGR